VKPSEAPSFLNPVAPTAPLPQVGANSGQEVTSSFLNPTSPPNSNNVVIDGSNSITSFLQPKTNNVVIDGSSSYVTSFLNPTGSGD